MSEFLSNIELYYSPSARVDKDMIELWEEEYHHAVKVMRNREGSTIHITNGRGDIFICTINTILKNSLQAGIIEHKRFENKSSNITFCMPVLKSTDRFKFALEKCIELGITNFIIFESARTVAKIKNINKWSKTGISAMKQSLRAHLPVISAVKTFRELSYPDGEKILFDQSSEKKFTKALMSDKKYFFIFGPEGGFTNEEIILFDSKYRLAENRLRTETAIIKFASIIS